MAKILKGGKEMATGTIARVLRGICFSGCGVVKNPANPPSVILETAKEKSEEIKDSEDVIILNYDILNEDNNVTSESVEGTNQAEAEISEETEVSEDITDTNCLRNQNIQRLAKKSFEKLSKDRAKQDKRRELLDGLKAALREAVKTQSR